MLCNYVSLFSNEATNFQVKEFFAEENHEQIIHSFKYTDIGIGPIPLPMPSIGWGKRIQKEKKGLDFNVRIASIFLISQVKGNLLFLHYPKPNLSEQFYIGAGIGAGIVYSLFEDKAYPIISPEFVLGKQIQKFSRSNTEHKSKTRFFQCQISVPTYAPSQGDLIYFPLISFQYGFGF